MSPKGNYASHLGRARIIDHPVLTAVEVSSIFVHSFLQLCVRFYTFSPNTLKKLHKIKSCHTDIRRVSHTFPNV